MWTWFGVNCPAFKPSREAPLVEELYAQTSLFGRYNGVISDIQGLIRDGVIIDSLAGKKRQLKISPAFHDFQNAIPYCR
jgi:hypothetical protein